MNEWVFWTGLALLVAAAWVRMAEGRPGGDWLITAGVLLWMADHLWAVVVDAYAPLVVPVTP